jgi:hypothetical protein
MEWANQYGAEVLERDENLGLAQSIVSGVSELCEKYSRAIVIEDDLILSPRFLDFMIRALDAYENEANVYQVSGYMFPLEHPPLPSAFFLPLVTTWGWATWRRAWNPVDWTAAGASEMLRDPKRLKAFDLDNSYPYSKMLSDRLTGQNDSWGILFWWTVFKCGGLVLHPSQSLVLNRGFDSSGTHCGDQSWSAEEQLSVGNNEPVVPFQLPDRVEIDESAFNRIKHFLKKEQYPTSLSGRLWRRIERYTDGIISGR